ncbi:helix-turn-helix transcriptional regulator [Isoptericola sp. NPDC055881]
MPTSTTDRRPARVEPRVLDPRALDGAPDVDGTTRRRVLELVAGEGPVSAAELADRLGLTSAAVRRHLACLEEDGTIAVHDGGPSSGRRGRPARRYVVSARGQSDLAGGYSELAAQVMRHLRETGGTEAVARFAAERYDAVVARYAPRLTAEDPEGRAAQLADLLSADGYAASVRPVTGPLLPTVQLCQGHCPVQHVAEEFGELCEAEARAFSELLGTHVQRLATIAGGAHACVTNVPTVSTQVSPQNLPTPAHRTRGTQEGTR